MQTTKGGNADQQTVIPIRGWKRLPAFPEQAQAMQRGNDKEIESARLF